MTKDPTINLRAVCGPVGIWVAARHSNHQLMRATSEGAGWRHTADCRATNLGGLQEPSLSTNQNRRWTCADDSCASVLSPRPCLQTSRGYSIRKRPSAIPKRSYCLTTEALRRVTMVGYSDHLCSCDLSVRKQAENAQFAESSSCIDNRPLGCFGWPGRRPLHRKTSHFERQKNKVVRW